MKAKTPLELYSNLNRAFEYKEYPTNYREFTAVELLLQIIGVWFCFFQAMFSMICIPLIIAIGLLLLPKWFMPLAIGYWCWYLYDKNSPLDGNPSPFLYKYARYAWWWKQFRYYCNGKLVKICEIEPHRNYILGFHPHGTSWN